jgi:hypothetical protein
MDAVEDNDTSKLVEISEDLLYEFDQPSTGFPLANTGLSSSSAHHSNRSNEETVVLPAQIAKVYEGQVNFSEDIDDEIDTLIEEISANDPIPSTNYTAETSMETMSSSGKEKTGEIFVTDNHPIYTMYLERRGELGGMNTRTIANYTSSNATMQSSGLSEIEEDIVEMQQFVNTFLQVSPVPTYGKIEAAITLLLNSSHQVTTVKFEVLDFASTSVSP